MPRSLLQQFRRLDAYAKPLDEVRIRTSTGAYVTFLSAIAIITLVWFEVSRFLRPTMEPEIVVDGGKMQKLPIHFNITFPHLPCYLLGMDLMDESGEHITGYDHDVFKVRLDKEGNEIEREKQIDLSSPMKQKNAPGSSETEYCGPCYGANPRGEVNPCCNTCDDVKRAYSDMGWAIPSEKDMEQCVHEQASSQSHEGCNIHGNILVSKVRGNFHFSPGHAFAYGGQHIHDVRSYLTTDHDFTHVIHQMQFGGQEDQKQKERLGLADPLDHTQWGSAQVSMMYQYFLKIVPTQFEYLNGRTTHAFQYSASRQERDLQVQPGGGLPGVFFMLDFSPMLVIYSEQRASLAKFLTGLCAIVGGIFAVASMVDGVLYRAAAFTQKKAI